MSTFPSGGGSGSIDTSTVCTNVANFSTSFAVSVGKLNVGTIITPTSGAVLQAWGTPSAPIFFGSTDSGSGGFAWWGVGVSLSGACLRVYGNTVATRLLQCDCAINYSHTVNTANATLSGSSSAVQVIGTLTAAITITLYGTSNQIFIKDAKGTVGTYPVTIVASSGTVIYEGGVSHASITLNTPYQAIQLVCDNNSKIWNVWRSG